MIMIMKIMLVTLIIIIIIIIIFDKYNPEGVQKLTMDTQ